jgi:hypothetical protein
MSNIIYLIMLVAMLLVALIFSSIALWNSQKEKPHKRPTSFVFLGILIGTIGGFVASWNLDSKDTIFYPVGYWMIVPPFVGFLGGLVGIAVYAFKEKRKLK